jgi:flagellar basal-body rod modification protein FlgD
MSVSATSATSSTTTSTSSTVSSQEEVSTETFLKLLTEELKNQDPLEPLTSEQMLTQISQLTTVGEISKLNENFSNLADTQGAALMANLVGRTVEWTDSTSGGAVSGVVDHVALSDGDWVVSVGDTDVPVGSITALQ